MTSDPRSTMTSESASDVTAGPSEGLPSSRPAPSGKVSLLHLFDLAGPIHPGVRSSVPDYLADLNLDQLIAAVQRRSIHPTTTGRVIGRSDAP
jgi:hypothetical protein